MRDSVFHQAKIPVLQVLRLNGTDIPAMTGVYIQKFKMIVPVRHLGKVAESFAHLNGVLRGQICPQGPDIRCLHLK